MRMYCVPALIRMILITYLYGFAGFIIYESIRDKNEKTADQNLSRHH